MKRNFKNEESLCLLVACALGAFFGGAEGATLAPGLLAAFLLLDARADIVRHNWEISELADRVSKVERDLG